MTTETRVRVLNEIRYAERLCQRSARLYRRLQAVGVFGSILGGSATLGALSSQLPSGLSIVGAIAFAAFGAMQLAVRPAEKATSNEADAKRYAKLRSEAHAMDDTALVVALDKARETDTAEIEPLRDVAWNDVVTEIGAEDAAVPLRWNQRLLAALA